MYGASGYTGQCGICAVCSGTDHCRRGRKGSVPITDGAIYNKEWNNKKGFKVVFGIENQTIKDKKMPLRVIAYDGASYRSQMLKKGAKEFCKVITLILHFGDNQWKDDKELREVINQESVNEELFQNYKLNVFDIAYLTEEQIKMFQSDF